MFWKVWVFVISHVKEPTSQLLVDECWPTVDNQKLRVATSLLLNARHFVHVLPYGTTFLF